MMLFLSADLVKARKLHGRLEFQGLPISVENRAGSRRYWYDPNADEHGSTKMKYPYGYVRGTLGMDGDAVDVFVGPHEDAEKVYVVTQMKRPGFKEVDEQKVMLGFKSAADAKKAYLEHYNDPKFFGSMKEFTMDEFKEKLTSHKGKLIKHLFLALPSANIQAVDKAFQSKAQQKFMYAAEERGEIPKKTVEEFSDKTKDFSKLPEHVKKGDDMDTKKSCEHSKEVTCEKCNGTHSTSDILKGLTSRMLSLTKRHIERQPVEAPPAESEFSTEDVQLFGPQVAQALHVDRPFEPPHVPVVSVATPAQSASPLAPDFMVSCGGCGYTHKSLSTCPRCEQIAATNREATPIWRR